MPYDENQLAPIKKRGLFLPTSKMTTYLWITSNIYKDDYSIAAAW